MALSTDHYSQSQIDRWPGFSSRSFFPESTINLEEFTKHNLIPFLTGSKLLLSLTYAKPYCPKIVHQFYWNMDSNFANPSSVDFGKVYVQGKVYTIFPAVIEQFLHLPTTQDKHTWFRSDLDKHTPPPPTSLKLSLLSLEIQMLNGQPILTSFLPPP